MNNRSFPYSKTIFGLVSNELCEGKPNLDARSEEHTSELQSRETISYAVFCLKKKKKQRQQTKYKQNTHVYTERD